MIDHVFGPTEQWPDQDLIAWSTEFTADLVLAAYRSGVFPMPLDGPEWQGRMSWWSPVHRGVLPLGGLRVSRSLRRSAKGYTTTVDLAFARVLARCADPARPGGWIDPLVIKVFTELHEAGVVHSVETWDAEGRLVGGLYGVGLGHLFAGESMFHDPELGRDGSKVALMRLVAHLRAAAPNGALLDVQWKTPHLASLGVVEVSRARYLGLLDAALSRPDLAWPDPAASRRPGDAPLGVSDA